MQCDILLVALAQRKEWIAGPEAYLKHSNLIQQAIMQSLVFLNVCYFYEQ